MGDRFDHKADQSSGELIKTCLIKEILRFSKEEQLALGVRDIRSDEIEFRFD